MDCGTSRLRRLALLLTAFAALLLVCAVTAGGALASRYRVSPGDTLTGIAAKYRVQLDVLASLNRLDPNGILLAGSVLKIPDPPVAPRRPLLRISVQPGDTLSAIAVRYGTTVAGIVRLNRLDPVGVLPAGRTLVLPVRMADRSVIRRTIVRWARHYGVRRSLALAVAWQESGHQPNLTSSTGAWGVMQVMPATWEYVETVLIGRKVPHTTAGGIRVGMAYLHYLLKAFGSKERLALAAYLQGEASVREHGIFPSSRPYVANILALAR
jgi:soluble lytic murein transglycosylase-like protein